MVIVGGEAVLVSSVFLDAADVDVFVFEFTVDFMPLVGVTQT